MSSLIWLNKVDFVSDLAQRLLLLRKNLGKSQQEMADLIGIPQRTWANYENGRSDIPLKTAAKLSSLGISLDWISTGIGSLGIESPIENVHRLGVEDRPVMKLKSEAPEVIDSFPYEIFKFSNGHSMPTETNETDQNAITLLPVFGQAAAAGQGQEPCQLPEIEAYIPIVFEMLGGAAPRNCGIVRVVGDSMTDMTLFNGDLAIFDRTQLEGDGIFVISIGDAVRIKRLEYRTIERKIIISSENVKRYPSPEILSYEQASNMLRVHGKVICWMHRHPY